ncbi:MAG: hypothetical protein JW708_10560, partial [Vallitaleaceae bacterium]|nr:hypothetical protein [Vallitaleaceae bacterium]
PSYIIFNLANSIRQSAPDDNPGYACHARPRLSIQAVSPAIYVMLSAAKHLSSFLLPRHGVAS